MKSKLIILMIGSSLLLTGCGSIREESYKDYTAADEISTLDIKPLSEYSSDTYPFKPEDIEFEIEKTEDEEFGTVYRLNYKNNTQYTITGLRFKFAFKSDTDKQSRIMRGITVDNWKIVRPGEYVTGSFLRNDLLTGFPVDDIDDYDIDNPVYLDISLSDDDVYEYKYSYNFDDKTYDEYQKNDNRYSLVNTENREWFPDTDVYKADIIDIDGEYVYARFFGIKDISDYNDYVNKIKSKGFTSKIHEGYYSFSAEDNTGKYSDIYYDPNNESIGFTISTKIDEPAATEYDEEYMDVSERWFPSN